MRLRHESVKPALRRANYMVIKATADLSLRAAGTPEAGSRLFGINVEVERHFVQQSRIRLRVLADPRNTSAKVPI